MALDDKLDEALTRRLDTCTWELVQLLDIADKVKPGFIKRIRKNSTLNKRLNIIATYAK